MRYARTWRRLSVLLLISQLLLLSGCDLLPTRSVVQVIQIPVPATLTEPTPLPLFNGRTYGDAIEYIPACVAAVQHCNADKAAIRGLDGYRNSEQSAAEVD